MPVLPLAVHRTIIAVDVEGFGGRHRINPHQVAVRKGLYQALRQAFSEATIPWSDCYREDRGDGVLILAPPEVAKSAFVESLPNQLVEGLREHNSAHPVPEQIRLRMAVHAGELQHDEHGVTGASINLTFRLLDTGPFKTALAGSPGVLALITSSWFFDEVVRHSPAADPDAYRRVRVTVKETDAVGWVHLPDHPYPPRDTTLNQARPVPARLPADVDLRAADSASLDVATSSPARATSATAARDWRWTVPLVSVLSAIVVVVAVLFGLNRTSSGPPPQAETEAQPEPGGMPLPNCPTCVPGGETFTEQVGGGNSKPTFRDPRGPIGRGPEVQPGQQVEVVCRFHDPNAALTVQPGWWYLIASLPWNWQYYTVANSYLNGDPPELPPGESGTPVDVTVPVC